MHFWQRPTSWENNHPNIRGCSITNAFATSLTPAPSTLVQPSKSKRGTRAYPYYDIFNDPLFSPSQILHHLTAAIRALKRQRRSVLMWSRQWHLSAQQGSLDITIIVSGLVCYCYKFFLQGTADKVLHWTPGMWQHRTEWYSHHKIESMLSLPFVIALMRRSSPLLRQGLSLSIWRNGRRHMERGSIVLL